MSCTERHCLWTGQSLRSESFQRLSHVKGTSKSHLDLAGLEKWVRDLDEKLCVGGYKEYSKGANVHQGRKIHPKSCSKLSSHVNIQKHMLKNTCLQQPNVGGFQLEETSNQVCLQLFSRIDDGTKGFFLIFLFPPLSLQ